MSTAAESTTALLTQTRTAVGGLARMAADLRTTVGTFRYSRPVFRASRLRAPHRIPTDESPMAVNVGTLRPITLPGMRSPRRRATVTVAVAAVLLAGIAVLASAPTTHTAATSAAGAGAAEVGAIAVTPPSSATRPTPVAAAPTRATHRAPEPSTRPPAPAKAPAAVPVTAPIKARVGAPVQAPATNSQSGSDANAGHGYDPKVDGGCAVVDDCDPRHQFAEHEAAALSDLWLAGVNADSVSCDAAGCTARIGGATVPLVSTVGADGQPTYRLG